MEWKNVESLLTRGCLFMFNWVAFNKNEIFWCILIIVLSLSAPMVLYLSGGFIVYEDYSSTDYLPYLDMCGEDGEGPHRSVGYHLRVCFANIFFYSFIYLCMFISIKKKNNGSVFDKFLLAGTGMVISGVVGGSEDQDLDAPHVDATHVDAHQVKAPKVDAPHVDAPQVDSPKVTDPIVEAQQVEAYKVDSYQVDAKGKRKLLETIPYGLDSTHGSEIKLIGGFEGLEGKNLDAQAQNVNPITHRFKTSEMTKAMEMEKNSISLSATQTVLMRREELNKVPFTQSEGPSQPVHIRTDFRGSNR